MIGILLIYWVGKYFYLLAEEYKQNKWVFAIIGIVVFYGSQFVFGLLLGVLNEIFEFGIDFDGVFINLIGIPIGLLANYILYQLLEKHWKKNQIRPQDSIDDIGTAFKD